MRPSSWITWNLIIPLLYSCGPATLQTPVSIPPQNSNTPSEVVSTPGLLATKTTDSPVPPTPTFITTEQGGPDAQLSPVPTEGPPVYSTPDWFDGAVLYEIFVRSFRDSDGDGIGDLAGVKQQLDYFQELGVDAIWLMPVYPSPSEHGYDVTDYYAINPDYGDIEDLQGLVEAAHARQIRVILDYVPSHLSSQHPFFQDAFGNPASEYSEWFAWTNDAHTTFATFGGNEGMPRFNHYNREVTEYLAQAALFWMDLDADGDYYDGIDGFRIDNATFPPPEFFVDLRREIKAANPEFLLLGEAWVHSASDLSRYFPDKFDSLFDFPLYETLQGSQDLNADGILAGEGFSVLLASLFEEEDQLFPEESIPTRFLNNHDTNRLASELKGDPERLKLAPALLAALPGAVLIYYGEELGMPGEKGGPPAWDNYRREPMDWYADETGEGQATWFKPADRWNQPADGISVEEQVDHRDSLLNTYRRLIQIRKANPALRAGNFDLLEFESSNGNTWGFVRSEGEEAVVAIYNFSAEPAEVAIDSFPFTAVELRDLITGQAYPGAERGDRYRLTVSGESAVLLAP